MSSGEARSFYSSWAWRRTAPRVVARDQVCRCCGQAPSTTDHHLIPRGRAPVLAFDETNLVAVLRSRHGRGEALVRDAAGEQHAETTNVAPCHPHPRQVAATASATQSP